MPLMMVMMIIMIIRLSCQIFDKMLHRMSCHYWWLNDPFARRHLRFNDLLRYYRRLTDHICSIHRSRDSVLFSGPVDPQISTSRGGSRPHVMRDFLGPYDPAHKRHLDRFIRFAGLTNLTNGLHATPSAATAWPHPAIAAIIPYNNNN